MSIDILDWIEWSDPINNLEDYNILQIKHWTRSDIKPQKNQLRLALSSYNLSHKEDERYFIFYTPALSSINGLDEHLNEIVDSCIVDCQLSTQIACQIKKEYSDNIFWYRVKINNVISFRDFELLVKPEYFNLEYYKLTENVDYFNPHLFQYKQWLFFSFNDQSNVGFDLIFRKTEDNLTLVYFCEWTSGYDLKSIITNYQLNVRECELVSSWIDKSNKFFFK